MLALWWLLHSSGNETVSLLNLRRTKSRLRPSNLTKLHRYHWTIKNLPETSYLLVYGTTNATTVKVDGKALPKLSAAHLGI